jgi:hypothetical protein
MKKKFSGQGALLGGTTYDFTALGPVKSITDLEASAGNLPNDGYIRYTIIRAGAAGNNITITTRFKKSGSRLCQSAFDLGATFTKGATSSLLYYSNDDHDTLVMQGDGTGVLSHDNVNRWTGNFDRFRGDSQIYNNASLDTCFQYSPSSFLTTDAAHLISFPKTNTNVWWNLSSFSFKVNDFPAQSLPASLTQYISNSAPTNSLISVSDGVNCFMLQRVGGGTALYVEIDLSNGTIYKSSTYQLTSTMTNATEEDAQGTQLFAVDGAISYYSNGSFYWGGPAGWRFATTLMSSAYSASVGASTQSDMDMFGSIDSSDGYVWFADWGHDDGGTFQVGNDSQLGTAKTNIRLIPNTAVI